MRKRSLTLALAFFALASGSVSAAPLDRDNRPDAPLWVGVSPQLVAKLGTNPGFKVLVFG